MLDEGGPAGSGARPCAGCPGSARSSWRALLPRALQLTALGILLGFSYVRTRNLLTPMLIHGAWNGTVLVVLYILTESGVDINQLLHGSV